MSKEKTGGAAPTGGKPNVVEMTSKCPVTECKSKVARSSFCNEHFDWFKAGLINRKGEKPKDFDKKYQAFIRRKAA